MLKALLKKQFLELNTFYFQDRKTGKTRKPLGIALYVLLFVFIFFSLGATFYGVSLALGGAMKRPPLCLGSSTTSTPKWSCRVLARRVSSSKMARRLR